MKKKKCRSCGLDRKGSCWLCDQSLPDEGTETVTNTYRGNCTAKKVARALMYIRIAQWDSFVSRLLPRYKTPGGYSAVLLGDDSSDVRVFDAFNTQRVIGIDRDFRCVLRAREKHESIKAYCGEIGDFLHKMSPRSIRTLILDLQGHPTDDVQSLIRLASTRLVPGAVFTLTFMRGREKGKEAWWKRAEELAEAFLERMHKKLNLNGNLLDGLNIPKARFNEIARMVGYQEMIRECVYPPGKLWGEVVIPVTSINYQTTSPMMTIVFVYCPGLIKELDRKRKRCLDLEEVQDLRNWWESYGWSFTFLNDYCPVDSDTALRQLAFYLLDTDTPPKIVSALCDTPQSTLSAWCAHRSRGTYEGEKEHWHAPGFIPLENRKSKEIELCNRAADKAGTPGVKHLWDKREVSFSWSDFTVTNGFYDGVYAEVAPSEISGICYEDYE